MDIEKIFEIINKIFQNDNQRVDVQDLDIQLEPLCGLSNQIHLVKIFDKNTKVLIKEFVYKVFGDNNEFMDRKLEEEIMFGLSSQGFGPKVLISDQITYRAEEYIKGTKDLEMNELMEEQILQQIIRILVSYSMMASVSSYNIFSDQFSTDYNIIINEGNHTKLKKNIYEMCTKSMLQKAKKNFQKFSHKFKERFDKILKKEIFCKYQKLKVCLKNYKEIFNKVFPKKGLLVLNHNDVHRLNFLAFDKNKLMLIDHEYAALNLIGIDIVNYMMESNFNYKVNESPFFEFTDEKFDLDKMFEVYLNYLDYYDDQLKSCESIQEINKKELVKECRSKDYFLRLICIVSLLWFLYSIVYLDFSSFEVQKSFDHLLHAFKRLEIFEKTYSMIETSF